jgi:hypothetical protein
LAVLQRVQDNWVNPAKTIAAYAIGSVAAMWLIIRISGP